MIKEAKLESPTLGWP